VTKYGALVWPRARRPQNSRTAGARRQLGGSGHQDHGERLVRAIVPAVEGAVATPALSGLGGRAFVDVKGLHPAQRALRDDASNSLTRCLAHA